MGRQIFFACLVSILSFAGAHDYSVDICVSNGKTFNIREGDSIELRYSSSSIKYLRMDCSVLIKKQPDLALRFEFSNFKTDRNYDLSFHNGLRRDSELIFKYNGTATPCDILVTSTDEIAVRFLLIRNFNDPWQINLRESKYYNGTQNQSDCWVWESPLLRRQRSLLSELNTTTNGQDHRIESLSSKLKIEQDKQDQLIHSLSSKLVETKTDQDTLNKQHSEALSSNNAAISNALKELERLRVELASVSSKLDATAIALKELKSSMITKNEMLAMLSAMCDRRRL